MKIDLTNMQTIKQTRSRLKSVVSKLSGLDNELERIKKRIEAEVVKPMMFDLKDYPRPRQYPEDYPIQFVSDAQRKYVMAKLNGKPYQRTGAIRRGWRYKLYVTDGKIILKLGNKSKHAQYVQGLYGLGDRERHIKRYRKPIMPYHMKTGWQEAHPIIHDAQRKALRIRDAEMSRFNRMMVRLLR